MGGAVASGPAGRDDAVAVLWQQRRPQLVVLGPVRQTKITPVVQWSSNSGHVLIISGKDGGLGVLHDSHYLPLPLGILRNPLVPADW